MSYAKIKYAVDAGVATITLNDPSTMNAAGLDLVVELAEVFGKIAAGDEGARAVVLTGEGRGFCSGANLSGRADPPPPGTAPARRGRCAGDALQSLRHPDARLPHADRDGGQRRGRRRRLLDGPDGRHRGRRCESAYFLQAFRRIGLVPDGGSTYLLPRLIGRARAMEMTMLGERVSAAKALEWGLINRVVPDADLMAEATKLAVELSNGPKALGADPQADVALDGRQLGRPAPRRSHHPERSWTQRRFCRRGEGFPGKASSRLRGEMNLSLMKIAHPLSSHRRAIGRARRARPPPVTSSSTPAISSTALPRPSRVHRPS